MRKYEEIDLLSGSCASLLKVILGYVTILMMVTMYLKIKITTQGLNPKLWPNRYRYYIYASLIGTILLNMAVFVSLVWAYGQRTQKFDEH
jgi:hypothetical protein